MFSHWTIQKLRFRSWHYPYTWRLWVLMWAQISLSAWVRGISATPPRNACISGETWRGFIIPLGSRFFVSVAGLAAADIVNERKTRTLAGAIFTVAELDEWADGSAPWRKLVKTPKDNAICELPSVCVCLWAMERENVRVFEMSENIDTVKVDKKNPPADVIKLYPVILVIYWIATVELRHHRIQ